MGSINYKKSDIITIGFDDRFLYNYDDEEIKTIMLEYETTEEEAKEILNENNYNYIKDCFDSINENIKKYNFEYFKFSLNAGYYEGFYFDFEFNYIYFDNYIEKLEALKELTIIKNILIDSVKNYNCLSVAPGWVTGYSTVENSIKEIKQAVKNERLKIKKMFTEKTFSKLSNIEKNEVLGFNLYK